jgi:hypothetical protein
MCTIKGDDFISLSRDVFVTSVSIAPEPYRRVTWLQKPPRSVGSLSFFGWQGNLQPLLTRDPAVYETRQNLTLCQRAHRLDISTYDDDSTTFLYDLMSFICTR